MPADEVDSPSSLATGAAKARAGKRPRSKLFLSLDLKNAYARLGVSPLASDKEISDRIGKLRASAVKRLKAKGNAAIDDPDQQEAFRLDKIEEEIGDPRKRKVYDERHPQNILLTVQPSPAEQAWARHRKAGLISNWVQNELGEDALCPTPSCLRLWAPSGLDPELISFLSAYDAGDAPRSASPQPPQTPADEFAAMLSFNDLAGLFE
jgi:hypothetical protein